MLRAAHCFQAANGYAQTFLRSFNMISALRRLMSNQNATTVIEYSLIICLIAVAAIGGMTKVGHSVLGMLGPTSNALQ
jgi:Flp pilus assembly pilin Flp